MGSLARVRERPTLSVVLAAAKQLLRFALVALAVHAVVFLAFEVLPDAAEKQLGIRLADPDLLNRQREALGLNGGLFARYQGHLALVAKLELGDSLATGAPVRSMFAQRASASLLVFVGSLALLGISVVLACGVAKVGRGAWLKLGVSPGLSPPFVWAGALWGICGALSLLILPGSSFAFAAAIICTGGGAACWLFCASMGTASEHLAAPHTVFHRALGASSLRVRIRVLHSVILVSLPAIRRSILMIGSSLPIVEPLFGVKGIGALFLEGVNRSDVPVVQAYLLLQALFASAVYFFEPQASASQSQATLTCQTS